MKKIILLSATIFYWAVAPAQLISPANGNSVKATVGERVGITDVTITYGRPAVRGREGKVWGDLVYEGFKNQGFGNGHDAPWRAGANENTVIEFSTDVLIDGRPLKAGKYGFFVAYGPNTSTLIFSSNTTSWGSFYYEQGEDVLRVPVKPVHLPQSQERLTYEFSDETDSSAVISLAWEKLAIPFTVSTQLQQLQLASYERELRGEKGFDPHSLIEVADYMQEHNVALDRALSYADRAAQSMPTFSVYMTKGQILEKMNKQVQADSMMKAAMGVGTMQEVHSYGRSLVTQKKNQKAFEVFQLNYKRFPNTFTTNVGMARGYAAIGKTKDALKYANLALPQAPNEPNRKAVEDMISKLRDGKEI